MEHEFTDDTQIYPQEVQQEILSAYKTLESVLGNDMDPFTDECCGTHRFDDEYDPEQEERVRHDDEQFNQLRHQLLG